MRRVTALLLILSLTVFTIPAFGGDNDTVSFLGEKKTLGFFGGTPCAPSFIITEQNGGFSLNGVAYSLGPEIATYEDGVSYRFVGQFVSVPSGTSGIDCLFFDVLSVNDANAGIPTYDPMTETLHIPELMIEGYGYFEADLGPPFSVLDFQSLEELP